MGAIDSLFGSKKCLMTLTQIKRLFSLYYSAWTDYRSPRSTSKREEILRDAYGYTEMVKLAVVTKNAKL